MASPSVASSRSKQPVRGAAVSDDVVMARAIQLAEWARRNARLIMIAAAVTAVAVGGYVWYRYQQGMQAERAALRFLEVERTANSGNATLAERDLADFARRFDGTAEADEARLMLAKIHLDANAPAKAVPVLQQVGQELDSPVGVEAAMLLAAAQNQAGQRDAAQQSYLRVADGAEMDYQRAEALEAAAVLREQAGNHAGAAELYRRLIDLAEEGSIERSVYEMRLAEAEGRAAGK
ncbi:MAG TPA: tetratricopeptide repeat protein [Longimicrobiaceae bacterium]